MRRSNDTRELLERAELRCEEAMDKKVELLTDAYERALKRRRCDDDDDMVTRVSRRLIVL